MSEKTNMNNTEIEEEKFIRNLIKKGVDEEWLLETIKNVNKLLKHNNEYIGKAYEAT